MSLWQTADIAAITANKLVLNGKPVNIYLFKVAIKTLEKSVKHVQNYQ